MTSEMNGTKRPRTMYQVKDWNEHFEGAKSREYNNKSACQMPTKHGLGYCKLVKSKNGPALFGAWCALIQVLSKHPKKRHGYLTDTGRADGNPFTPEDLEMLTNIPASLYKQLFQVASSEGVNWLRIPDGYQRDATVLPWGGIDSDSDSDSDLDSTRKLCQDLASQLLESVSRATGRKLVSTPKASTKPIQQLLKKGITEKEVLEAITWLEHENPKNGKYALVVESGNALLEKWDRLQALMTRKTTEPQPDDIHMESGEGCV